MSNYTIKQDPSFPDHSALFENDKPKVCPFHTPMTTQGKFAGSVNLVYRNCGTLCALFEVVTVPVSKLGSEFEKMVTEEMKIERVRLHCTGTRSEFYIRESVPTPENSLKLV